MKIPDMTAPFPLEDLSYLTAARCASLPRSDAHEASRPLTNHDPAGDCINPQASVGISYITSAVPSDAGPFATSICSDAVWWGQALVQVLFGPIGVTAR